MSTDFNNKIYIYADGACSGNPGPGGFGVVMRYLDRETELSGAQPQTTNNRMELLAIISALEHLKRPCNCVITTDSQYVVEAVSKGWAVSWRKRGWIKSDKNPAKNPDLWERLLNLLEKHKCDFVWVKGHNGHAENERCDELARAAIKTLN